jgi:hypothetical protein
MVNDGAKLIIEYDVPKTGAKIFLVQMGKRAANLRAGGVIGTEIVSEKGAWLRIEFELARSLIVGN